MKQAANQSVIRKAALGALVSLLTYLALTALLALLIVRGTVGEGGVTACAWAFALLAAFAGAKTASFRVTEPLIPLALTAALFWALVLLLGFLVNDTLDGTRAALLALPIFFGAALAYLLRGGGKKRGKHKRRSHK